ncbi:uncharacterized protein LOC133552477 [Nerophis ophidion]|uniref:uncharacterized protein LOC133552477 n=1 Tax=Nerophis ophidion TaxID=159077 RepID=UPI002AE038F1|nr:uncharacterized protein LOC133552477 [Nerophis ophidion]
MLWGWFSASGTERPARIEGKMNAAMYRDILEGKHTSHPTRGSLPKGHNTRLLASLSGWRSLSRYVGGAVISDRLHLQMMSQEDANEESSNRKLYFFQPASDWNCSFQEPGGRSVNLFPVIGSSQVTSNPYPLLLLMMSQEDANEESSNRKLYFFQPASDWNRSFQESGGRSVNLFPVIGSSQVTSNPYPLLLLMMSQEDANEESSNRKLYFFQPASDWNCSFQEPGGRSVNLFPVIGSSQMMSQEDANEESSNRKLYLFQPASDWNCSFQEPGGRSVNLFPVIGSSQVTSDSYPLLLLGRKILLTVDCETCCFHFKNKRKHE